MVMMGYEKLRVYYRFYFVPYEIMDSMIYIIE